MDSTLTQHKIILAIEKLETKSPISETTRVYQVPSLFVTILANTLNNPFIIFRILSPNPNKNSFSIIEKPLPCDLHLLNLRTISKDKFPSNTALLIYHRFGVDCNIKSQATHEICHIHYEKYPEIPFNFVKISHYQLTKLTGLDETNASVSQSILKPMDLQTLKIHFE